MTKIKNFLSRHSTALNVFAYALIIYTLATAAIMLCIDGLTYLADTPETVSGYWSMIDFKRALRALPVIGFIPSQLIWIRIAIYLIVGAISVGLLLLIDKVKTEEKEAQDRINLANYLESMEIERKRIKAKKISTMRTLHSLPSSSSKEKEKKTAWMKESV